TMLTFCPGICACAITEVNAHSTSRMSLRMMCPSEPQPDKSRARDGRPERRLQQPRRPREQTGVELPPNSRTVGIEPRCVESGDYKSAGMSSGVNKRLHSCDRDSVPLVSRSANYYLSRPLVAGRRCRRRVVMIVKSARLR